MIAAGDDLIARLTELALVDIELLVLGVDLSGAMLHGHARELDDALTTARAQLQRTAAACAGDPLAFLDAPAGALASSAAAERAVKADDALRARLESGLAMARLAAAIRPAMHARLRLARRLGSAT